MCWCTVALDPLSIMFVNRVFPPDRGATGRCLADLGGRLAAAGWRVTVVTDGAVAEGATPRPDAPTGIAVHRTGGSVPEGGRPSVRAYLDSLCRLTGLALRLPRHDVIVTMTDPPMLALAGPMLAARHGAASLHWCHDLYPDLLPVLGVGMPAAVLGLARRGMARALRRHDRVVAIGRCMRDRIADMGVAADRLTLLPNWPDPVIRPQSAAGNGFRRSLGLEDGDGRILIAYSGTLGLAHPMNGVLDAAARLQESDPALLFLLTGEGRGFAAVEEAARSRGLRNLRRLPWQPAGRLAESLSAADLHLVTMDPAADGMMVPSKLAGVQAAGRPCLFLGPRGGEAVARVAGCGLTIDPFDGAAIADAVRAYAADPARRAVEGALAARRAAGWTADHAAAAFADLAAGAAKGRATAKRAVRPVMGRAAARSVEGRPVPNA